MLGEVLRLPFVASWSWFFRSLSRLLTGVAESINTWVLTPSLMTFRMSRS